MTPRRLQENEDYIWSLADRQFDEFIANGRCEFLSEYGKPFATLAIADLLGVPDKDRPKIRHNLGAGGSPGGDPARCITNPSAATRCSTSTTCSATTLPSVASRRAKMY